MNQSALVDIGRKAEFRPILKYLDRHGRGAKGPKYKTTTFRLRSALEAQEVSHFRRLFMLGEFFYALEQAGVGTCEWSKSGKKVLAFNWHFKPKSVARVCLKKARMPESLMTRVNVTAAEVDLLAMVRAMIKEARQ